MFGGDIVRNNVSVAIDTLRANKLRSGLTILGVVIGVSTVMMMAAIVGIGVVVGGIVIMNIMMMSVTERTHEIGIRKAMGATGRDIRRQFLAESVALAFIGGLSGVMVGWGMAALIAVASPLPARITAWSVALALSLGAGTLRRRSA